MWFQIKSYLNFLWNSKNQHGVHSPFVFLLVTQCFYDKKKYPQYKLLKDYRNALLRNKNTIEVSDFGAGSRVFKSNTRAINQIAKNAGISQKRAELLFRITQYFQAESILEIGTSLGLATSALSLGNPKANITSLEGCPNTMAVAQSQAASFQLNNIRFINTKFEDYLSIEIPNSQIPNSKTQIPKPTTNNLEPRTYNLKPSTQNLIPNTYNLKPKTYNLQPRTYNLQPKTYNLIYFDGNHSQKATLDYFESLLSTITNNSVWIFDDIHWSADMEEAWEIIKQHPKVKVTIDTFQWGIVFFRSEQAKEHFTIRA